MKKVFKKFVSKIFPDVFYAFSSYRFFRHCKKKFGDFQDHFCHRVFKSEEITILNGPFKGMKYFNEIVWGPITPKWIGSYEKELHPIIGEIISAKYDRILDIGAAEGYYAVGLSLKCPRSAVSSYDIDPIARKRQAQLASLNSVTNLEIGKYCSVKEFANIVTKKTLIICDIEGSEYELLTPDRGENLRIADILVEIHPYDSLNSAEVQQSLCNRFASSHEISTIRSEPRVAGEWVEKGGLLENLEEQILKDALDEHRQGSQGWLWMRSKQGLALSRGN